ncbi:restriction endonuclease subunit S [Kaistella carnis]|uniref:Restriction endonuclease subunit S n=1 Tax=Kaistella carnis TaxID=1241979 RepID=A0A3G8XHY1_9FLAO|nr:restriction endonuclease subunit S [Kaistella carnis]AZI32980.1 restriction endonuclease subunit S [Kaistella carnis]
MREGWKEVKIGDYCRVLSSKRVFANDYVEKGIPFYRSKEIIHKATGVFSGDEVFISEKRFREFKEKFGAPIKGDILMSSVGNRSGVAYFVKEEYDFYFKDGNLIWMKDFSKGLCSKYLEFYLRSQLGEKSIESMMIGAAQKALTIDGVKKIKLNLPPIETQRKIASILSGYDDLIENNLKRIKILEEMAQQTYEDWFVRMRFPGYETAVMNEETGLPEGWENGTIETVTKYLSGFAFKSAHFKDNGNGVIRIKNIGNNTINLSDVAYVDNEYASKQKRYLLKSGDLLIAMTGATIGKVGIMPHSNESFYLNQRVGKFVTENTAFLNCFFNSTYGINQVINIAGGAAQPNISAQQILDIELVVPSKQILDQFSDTFNKGISIIINLQSQNQRLREARDLLLPRLMMGIVEV